MRRREEGWLPWVLLLVVTPISIVVFQNCAEPFGEVGNEAHGSTDPSFSELVVPIVDVPVPSQMCGIEGFTYLNKAYLQGNCGECHDTGGFAEPHFATADHFASYSAALSIPDERMLATVKDNRFCGVYCSLDPEHPVYQRLVQWLNNKYECP